MARNEFGSKVHNSTTGHRITNRNYGGTRQKNDPLCYRGKFTLWLTNSIGFVAKRTESAGHDYMTEWHKSPHPQLMIAKLSSAYEPDLVVMDGVEAFVRGEPAEGKRVKPGVVLAGRDRVALNTIGVAILRMFGTTPEAHLGRIFEQE